MVSVSTDSDDYLRAARELQDQHMLFAVHTHYDAANAAQLVSDEWIRSIQPANATFAFLIAKRTCKKAVQEQMQSYVYKVRSEQKYPVFLMDMTSDILYIDTIISEDPCSICFDPQGRVCTTDGYLEGDEYSFFKSALKDILERIEKLKEKMPEYKYKISMELL